MFTINVITTHNVVVSVAPQTQEWGNKVVESLRSLLDLYTPEDVQAVADLEARDKAMKVRLDQIDSHLNP